MKNKKIEKILVKAGVGAAITFALGMIYKIGEQTSDRIDEKYEREHDVPKKLWG